VIRTIIGLDLAATFQKKKVGLAVVKIQGDVFALTSVQLLKSSDEILDAIQKAKPPVLLAIDAPLKLALSDEPDESNIRDMESQWPMVYTYRPWEYLVFEKLKKKYGISGRPFSSLTITYRAQLLRGLLEKVGWKLISLPEQMNDRCFTEVFPNLTMGIMGFTKQKRSEFVSNLFQNEYCGISLLNETGKPLNNFMDKEDILDAIICVWTGSLFARSTNQSKMAVCLGDDKYGFVICPYTRELESFLMNNPADLIYSHNIL
jgi:hypothetical protein